MTYGALSGGRGGLGSPYSDLEGAGLGRFSFRAPRVKVPMLTVVSKPLAAIRTLAPPVDRFIPGALARKMPGGGAISLAAIGANPLLAARAIRLTSASQSRAVPAGYVPAAAPAQQFNPGWCYTDASGRVVQWWRQGAPNPPIRRPDLKIHQCLIDGSNQIINGSIDNTGYVTPSQPAGFRAPVFVADTNVPSAPVNGLGAWLGALPSAPGSSINPTLMPDPVAGPPADVTKIAEGFAVDLHRGDVWIGVTKVAILPALFSAIAIKIIMFGGSYAGNKARAAVSSRFAKAPASA